MIQELGAVNVALIWPMQIKPLSIPGVFLVTLPHMADERGSFTKTFHHAWRDSIPEQDRPIAADWEVRESFFSRSEQGVLRGLHFQEPPFATAKWVTCLQGSFLDVFLDLRCGSPTFGKCESVILNAEVPQMLYLPVGIAHGFYTLSAEALALYYCSQAYTPEQDKGILWSSVDFAWPQKNPLLSPRDAAFPRLEEYASPFEFNE